MMITHDETDLYKRIDRHTDSPHLACSVFWESHPLSAMQLCPEILGLGRRSLAMSPVPQKVSLGHRYLGGPLAVVLDRHV